MTNKNPHEEHEEKLRLRDFVVFAGRQYCVSTVDLGYYRIKYPFETLVFPAEDGKIMSWDERYSARYKTEDKAVKGHKYVCEHLGDLLE